MDAPARTRLINPVDPGGSLVCSLTAERAALREAPISRLIEQAEFSLGYELRLVGGDAMWALANRFAEEEADCCPAMSFEVEERGNVIVLRAATT